MNNKKLSSLRKLQRFQEAPETRTTSTPTCVLHKKPAEAVLNTGKHSFRGSGDSVLETERAGFLFKVVQQFCPQKHLSLPAPSLGGTLCVPSQVLRDFSLAPLSLMHDPPHHCQHGCQTAFVGHTSQLSLHFFAFVYYKTEKIVPRLLSYFE